MKYTLLLSLVAGSLLAAPAPLVAGGPLVIPALAQTKEDAIRIATEMKVCDPLAVTDAEFLSDGRIKVTCGEATAFVPLLGGLAPALGLGAAGVAAAAAAGGGGGSTPDTQR